MLDEENLKKIESIHNAIFNKMDTATEIFEKLNIARDGLKTYMKLVEEFFSGKKDRIKNIYAVIRENRYPYNKVVAKDIESISEKYFSYFKGLKDFLDIISDLKDTDNQDINKIYSTIKNVIIKDTEFLYSLFNNSGTEKTLDAAMKNVEQLINLNDTITEFINTAENIYKEINNSESKNYADVVSAAYDGFLRSFGFFIYRSISEIFLTFENIENSMKTRVQYSQRNNAKPDDYQMF